MELPQQKLWSIHPLWLEHSINMTRRKLAVQTIDCVYLSDPFEMGMRLYKDPKELLSCIGDAFSFLEELRRDGVIASYGI